MNRHQRSILNWVQRSLSSLKNQRLANEALVKNPLDQEGKQTLTRTNPIARSLRFALGLATLAVILGLLGLITLQAQTPNAIPNSSLNPAQAPLTNNAPQEPKSACSQQKLPKSCPVFQKELANCNSSQNTWGCIDWENFKAYGLGELKPQELYQNSLQNRNSGALKAREGLRQALFGLAIDSKMTLEESVDFRPIFQQHFQTLVQQSFLVDQREASKQLYSLVELSLLPFFSVYWNYRNLPTEEPAPKDASATTGPTFSGLLLNATDVSLRPALFPMILSEQGEKLFTLTAIHKNRIEAQGFFRYSTNLASLRSSGVLGSNPLVLKVAAASGKYPVDLVLAEKEARIFLTLKQTQKFLQEGKIAVLYKAE